MPAPLKSRDEVLGILLRIFRAEGYDGASLAVLSEATGLGKSSLYHYFPGGKEDMANQVLDKVDAWMVEQIVAPLGAAGPPRQRLEHMLEVLTRFYDNGALARSLKPACRVPQPVSAPRMRWSAFRARSWSAKASRMRARFDEPSASCASS
jgi:AcrR family transcriptional regulator